MTESLSWVTCDGGPLVLIPAESLAAWRGGDGPDFDRAVAASTDYLGVLDFDSSAVVVLGGDELDTAWMPRDHGGVFVRWDFAPSEPEVLEAVRRLSSGSFSEPSVNITIGGAGLELQAASEAGSDNNYPRYSLSIEPGRYKLDTAFVKDDGISLIVHRLAKES